MRRMFLAAVAVAAAVLVVPTLWPAAASDGRSQRSFTVSALPAPVTLTVSLLGKGTGWVTSYPAGISCGTICSAQFPDATTVYLMATPATGSTLANFATTPPPYLCGVVIGDRTAVPDECQIFLSTDTGPEASVQATFNVTPPLCIVPGVERLTLATAELHIRRHYCGVGKVKHALSRKVRQGHVISQDPRAGWRREQGAKVNLVVSRGRP